MATRIWLAYLLLVGLPVLLMLGTLHFGRSMAAPLSIGGSWALTLDPDAHLDGCDGWHADPGSLTAELLQSGHTVAIGLNDAWRTVLNGTLSYNRLIGTSAPLRMAGCREMGLAIDANVINGIAGRAIAGRFMLAGCPECGSIPFRASLQGRPNAKE